MGTPKMVTFRADEDNVARYDAAAKAAGVSRSIWLREVADAACNGHTQPQPLKRSAHPDYALRRLGKSQLTTTCQHPTPARKQLAHTVECTICGATLR